MMTRPTAWRILGLTFLALSSACSSVPTAPEPRETPAATSSPTPTPTPAPTPTVVAPAPSPIPMATATVKPAPEPTSAKKVKSTQGLRPEPEKVIQKPAPAPSPTEAARADLPALLQEVERKYAQAETLVADFVQENEIAALGRKKKSSGTIMVKRPDKVRWETLSPDKNLLVSDGKTLWHYTPPFDPSDPSEHGQVIRQKAEAGQSKLAQALLSGSFSVATDMKIEAQADSEFALIPKKKGAAGSIERATLSVNSSQKLIEKVILEHRGGNRSEITLTNIKLGKNLEDEAFRFKAPPNTDEIKPD